MANRICACCGTSYKERHDYEQCYRDCEARVDRAKRNLCDAFEHLLMAETRRTAQRDGIIN